MDTTTRAQGKEQSEILDPGVSVTPAPSRRSQTSSHHKRNTGNSTSIKDATGPWVHQYVLSLDGGGVRGYSSLLILKALMEEIENQEKGHDLNFDSELLRPCVYFDYIFGTSTGGLIAIMLGRLRLCVPDALRQYEDLAGKVFNRRKPFSYHGILQDRHNHRRLESAVEQVIESALKSGSVQNQRPFGDQQHAAGALGTNLTFDSDPVFCRTVCTAFSNINDDELTPFLFRSYEHHRDIQLFVRKKPGDQDLVSQNQRSEDILERNPGPAHAFPIWQIARATTAATGYFKSLRIDAYDFVDGGEGCNNPALEAFQEVSSMHNQSPRAVTLLLSIGTGKKKRSGPATHGHFSGLFRASKAAFRRWNDTEAVHQVLLDKAKTLKELDVIFNYHRLNTGEKVGKIKMNAWRQNTSAEITHLTNEYLRNKQPELQEIAKVLVKARRERAKTDHWPVYSTPTRYRCAIKGCPNGHKVRLNPEELQKHLARRHELPPTEVPTSTNFMEQIEKVINAGRLGPLRGGPPDGNAFDGSAGARAEDVPGNVPHQRKETRTEEIPGNVPHGSGSAGAGAKARAEDDGQGDASQENVEARAP